jgi:hypothetical protein
MAKSKTRRQRPAPQRTCIICRQTQSKRQLIRIVRTPTSGVQLDPTGKLAGRGAYLCRSRSCWQRALGSSKLSAALKTTLTIDELAALQSYAAGLPETVNEEPPAMDPSSTELSTS